jgi:hypothetical protein
MNIKTTFPMLAAAIPITGKHDEETGSTAFYLILDETAEDV